VAQELLFFVILVRSEALAVQSVQSVEIRFIRLLQLALTHLQHKD